MLIRRDDVEHLIMTGGPVDVVIETGIAPPAPRPAAVAPPPREQAGFRRPPVLGRGQGPNDPETGAQF